MGQKPEMRATKAEVMRQRQKAAGHRGTNKRAIILYLALFFDETVENFEHVFVFVLVGHVEL
jgi:hypothetical protein